MAYAMVPIFTQTVPAGNASATGVVFNNIPSGYTDLRVEISGRTATTDTGNFTQLVLYVNTEPYPASTHSYTHIEANSSTAYSGRETGAYIRVAYLPSANATSNTFGNVSVYIPNYSGTTFKQIISDSVTENNSGSSESVKTSLFAGLYRSNNVIRSLFFDTGRLMAGNSTFTLYGIKNA